jgi:hypothetical protein
VPTKNKRISVIISPELDAALRDLKDASGMSPANYVRQVMEVSTPTIRKMAEAFRIAKRNPEAGLVAFQNLTDAATVTGAQLSLDMDKTRAKLRRVRKARSS